MYATLSSYTTFEPQKESYADPLITFIIPSIGRPTLANTIASLQRMENPNWKAIVVFDGVEEKHIDDARVTTMRIEKTGMHNYAGRVRNSGIQRATTEWVGFVDDDDTLQPTYVTRFHEHVEKAHPDVIIFRMKNSDGRILPRPDQTDFFKNEVGISFCVRRTHMVDEGLWFEPSSTEDFDLLDRLRQHNKSILISPFVEYMVR